jgi:ClpP class serine protease
VDEGRKGKLKDTIENIAVGKIWTADDALKLGLIDDIKYPDEVIAQVASDIGVANPKVIKLKAKGGFFEALGASSPFGGGSTKIELHIDPQQVREAATTKIEYLYTGPTP